MLTDMLLLCLAPKAALLCGHHSRLRLRVAGAVTGWYNRLRVLSVAAIGNTR